MSHTFKEIHGQAAAWRETVPSVREQWAHIRETLHPGPETHYLFVGSGTSFYLAQAAAQSFQEITGSVSSPVPSSEIFLSPASTVPARTPVVAFVISRSGSTSEALIAADYLGRNLPNVETVGITCKEGTELEERTKHTVTLPHAAEQSVVMTRSFTSMLLALQVIAGLVADNNRFLDELRQLPDMLAASIPAFEDFAEAIGGDLSQQQFIYLGLGAYRGLAEEATLKLKEMTQTPCEAYNPLEFRHGPISIIGPGTTTVLLEGLRDRDYLPDLEADVKHLGAQVVALSPYPAPRADMTLDLPPHLSDVARCSLYIPPVQLIAYFRARALGLNPDEPRHLSQVVVLQGGR